MKNMKKLAVLLLAFVMVVSMATTAFAAEIVNNTTHDYKAYQIFSGTQNDNSVNLGNPQWGNGIDPIGLIEDLKEANPELYASVPSLKEGYTLAEDQASAEAVIAALQADEGEGVDYYGDADQFANIAANHIIKGNGIEIGSETKDVDLPAGYYLIVDVTEVTGDDDANNPALLQITNDIPVLIAKKYNVPTDDKDIVHVENGEKHTTDLDAHSVGDTVHFELTGTMANNLEDYEEYRLAFHDKMSKGLTFQPDSVKVYVDGQPLEEGWEVVYGDEHVCSFGENEECTFEVVFEDIMQISAIKNNSKVTVAYDAILNSKAVVNVLEPNKSRLEFSNDPNWNPDDPDNEDKEPPTGITPWNEVNVVYTKIELTKVDGLTNNPLIGAEFTLTGNAANVVIISKMEFVEWTEGETKYWKLLDGTYTDTDPEGEGIDTSKYVKNEDGGYDVYKSVTTTNEVSTKGEGAVAAKAEVGADGKLSFSGLGPGTYTLTETKTPGGYNTIEPLTLVVGYDKVNKVWTYDWSHNGASFDTSANITVKNYQGAVLPETGGVGTTMFYVCGGIMVAAAVILLISKKRKAEEN